MNEEIVRFEKVSFSYDRAPVLEDIDFSVKKNEFVVLMGPNGGGKSTMLKIMLGLLKPDQGHVTVFGKEPSTQREKIGYLAQTSHFDFSFPISVMDLVLMGRYRKIGTFYSGHDRDVAMQSLEKVQLASFHRRHISELSGGQLQRVLIARAISRKPLLLLLDEPMSSVDPEAQRSVYEILGQLNKDMAILFITHDTSVVFSSIGSIACLNRTLYYHGPAEGSLGKLAEAYQCPVEVLSHGIPHRVLEEHVDD